MLMSFDYADAVGETAENPYTIQLLGDVPSGSYVKVGTQADIDIPIDVNSFIRIECYTQDMGVSVWENTGYAHISGVFTKSGLFEIHGEYVGIDGLGYGEWSYGLHIVMGTYTYGQNYSTAEDPYTGVDYSGIDSPEGTLYVLQGSPIKIQFSSNKGIEVSGNDEGLVLEGGTVTGTAESTGFVRFYDDGFGTTVNLYIVPKPVYPDLIFESDPTVDGVIEYVA